MEHPQKCNLLPNIERAMKDLEALKADIDEQKRIIKYYQDFFVETTTKIQNTLIRQNEAKLVESSKKEKMKQTVAIASEDGKPIGVWHIKDLKPYQSIIPNEEEQ